MNNENNLKHFFFNILFILITSITIDVHTNFSIKSFSKSLYSIVASKINFLSKFKKNTPAHSTKYFVTGYFKNSSNPSYYEIYTTNGFSYSIRTKIEIKEPLRNQKLLAAFSYLTKTTPSKIPLMKIDKDHIIAAVDTLDGSININEELIEKLPPSQIVRILLHEFRHIQEFKQLNEQKDQELTEQKTKSPYSPIIPTFWHKFYHPEVLAKAQKKLTPSSPLFNPWWNHQEHDADHFAAHKISCPICLKIVQAKTTPFYLTGSKIGDNKHLMGYFGFEDYAPCIEAIQENKRCPAHTKRSNIDDAHNTIITELENVLDEINKLLNDPEFQEGLQDIEKNECVKAKRQSLRKILSNKEEKYKKLYNEICNLDNQSGNLLLHLPSFGKDVVNNQQNNQYLWQTILENEKKRRLIKLLPESCNSKTR